MHSTHIRASLFSTKEKPINEPFYFHPRRSDSSSETRVRYSAQRVCQGEFFFASDAGYAKLGCPLWYGTRCKREKKDRWRRPGVIELLGIFLQVLGVGGDLMELFGCSVLGINFRFDFDCGWV